MKITEIAHRNRVARIEEQLKQNKLIVAKRNQMVTNMIDNFTDPLWVGNLVKEFFKFTTSQFASHERGMNKPTLIEYFILLELRSYLSFTVTDVLMVMDKVPDELKEGAKLNIQYGIYRIRSLRRIGYIRSYKSRVNGQAMNVVTPQGKTYLWLM